MTDYQFHTAPYPHQAREFDRSRDAKTWALFLEQRTGKTKLAIDTVAYNYERRKIDAMLVVAPPGVHAQWVMDEIPLHLPPQIPYTALIWRTGKAPKTFAKMFKALIDAPGLAILAVNRQAVITKNGMTLLKQFLQDRDVFFIWDESADIRTPSAITTRTAWKLGRLAKMRRILAGVPAPEGPMDLYAQYRFLHEGILKCRNFMEFKLTYGEWTVRNRTTMEVVPLEESVKNWKLRPGLFMIPKRHPDGSIRYKNLDQLTALTAWRTSRVTQQEAFPHLPARQYQRFYVDLTPEQLDLYNQLAEEYQATIGDRTLDVPLLITRLLRLQQVVCGYLPMPITEDLPLEFDWFTSEQETKVKYEVVRIPGANHRLAVLDEILSHRGGDPSIIWCRFKPDIDLVTEWLSSDYTVARYDGSVSQEERESIKQRFQRGAIDVLVGNQQAGGTGLTLKPAQTVIYYSNYFGLLPRLQSEERPIHGNLTRPVLYADIVARTTLEERLVEVLQQKRDLFQELMGDRARIEAWFNAAA